MLNRLNHLYRRPAQGLLTLFCAAAVLTACGGGGTSGGTATETRSSFASGPITGFGSIIVNGVRFDDTSARVSSDDDDNNESRSSSDLKLGMFVEVQGGGTTSDDTGRHGTANEVRFGSELVGPVGVGSINAAAKTFSLLGQKVQVNDNTIFDDSLPNKFASIKEGDILEVHGLFDAANKVYNATRIEPKLATFFKLRGVIQGLNTSAQTFTIGGELISYKTLSPQPSGLANDQIVRVKLDKTKVNGAWVATKIKSGVRHMDDHDEAEIKGTISDFKSISEIFKVNGIPVDGSKVTNPPAGIGNGVEVEVEGRAVNGTIIAAKIQIEDRNQAGAGEFEFHGLIERLNEKGTNTFMLRTMTISFDDRTSFEKGATATNLKNGDRVEVKAVSVSGSTTLRATRIRLEIN